MSSLIMACWPFLSIVVGNIITLFCICACRIFWTGSRLLIPLVELPGHGLMVTETAVRMQAKMESKARLTMQIVSPGGLLVSPHTLQLLTRHLSLFLL